MSGSKLNIDQVMRISTVLEQITRPPWDDEQPLALITEMRSEIALLYHAAREGGLDEQEASIEARTTAIGKFLLNAIEHYRRCKE